MCTHTHHYNTYSSTCIQTLYQMLQSMCSHTPLDTLQSTCTHTTLHQTLQSMCTHTTSNASVHVHTHHYIKCFSPCVQTHHYISSSVHTHTITSKVSVHVYTHTPLHQTLQQTCLPHNTSVSTPNSLCPYFQIFDQIFVCGCTTNQSKQNSVIHRVCKICELTSSIQTHYTQTTLFCLHLQKSFSIKDRITLSPVTDTFYSNSLCVCVCLYRYACTCIQDTSIILITLSFFFVFVLFWFFLRSPAIYLWGSPLLGEIFANVTVFLIQPLR